MSAQLLFTVKNQTITRTDNFRPVAKSQNYLRAGFEFSEDWGINDKIAIFRSGSVSYEMLLDSNNECVVPWEVLTDPGWLYVSAYSGDRITSGSARVTVYETGYTENVSPTQDPTRDTYTLLMERIEIVERMADLGLVLRDGVLNAVYDGEETA